ncbi:MAG: hypothetical protein GY732_05475 [Gammaproteobacteria bacterium]|nr:hypothetical protein [Gammaproteobacteria bacterium]
MQEHTFSRLGKHPGNSGKQSKMELIPPPEDFLHIDGAIHLPFSIRGSNGLSDSATEVSDLASVELLVALDLNGQKFDETPRWSYGNTGHF